MTTMEAMKLARLAANRTAPVANSILRIGANLAFLGLGILMLTEGLKGMAIGIDELADTVNR